MSEEDEGPDVSSDSKSENNEVSVDDLIDAVRDGILEDVRTLVTEYGVDVNAYSSKYRFMSALHVACINGHTDVAKFLIENGADVNQKAHPASQGFKEITAIHHACQFGHRDTVELLLAKGASLHSAAEDGLTPVHVACKKGNVELVNYLLGMGVAVDERDAHGNTLLMTAAIFSRHEMVVNLLEKGANVNYRNEFNSTPLYVACLGGHDGIVRTLMAHGAEVEAQGAQLTERDPLCAACRYLRCEVMQTLLTHGVEVDTYDSEGLTPLHIVCRTHMVRSEYKPEFRTTNKAHAIKLLLEFGVDPNVLDKKGFTPLESVCASEWGLGVMTHHGIAVMLDYGSGVGVPCHAQNCGCKNSVLMCLYLLCRSLVESASSVMQEEHSCFQNHAKCIIDTYEKYFIKTKLAGVHRYNDEKAVEPPVKGVDWDLASREAFESQCEAELIQMKTDLIGETGATYFSLLTRDLPALRRQQLFGQLTSNACIERYPIYGTMIFSSYIRLRRIFLEKECLGFFTITSPPLPPDCAEFVFCHLPERDLVAVVTVYRAHLLHLKKLKRNSLKRKIHQD